MKKKCEICQILTLQNVVAPCGHEVPLCNTCQKECPLTITDICAACESKEDED